MDFSRFQEISLANFPASLDLAQSSVHVWSSSLDLAPERLRQLAETLSVDEQARANRFRFERDRHGFIAGRGILRLLLAQYLNADPAQLQFTYSSRGKPVLAGSDYAGISFNVSHSNGLALYAVTNDRPIGIDVEYLRSMQDMEQLAERYFLPSENALIQAFSPEQRHNIFFRLWTCKEAYLKATGEGITGLKRVEVSLKPGEEWGESIVSLNLNNCPAVDWTVLQLSLAPDYAAALAVEGSDLQVFCYSLLYSSAKSG